jgi:hypothetical protein
MQHKTIAVSTTIASSGTGVRFTIADLDSLSADGETCMVKLVATASEGSDYILSEDTYSFHQHSSGTVAQLGISAGNHTGGTSPAFSIGVDHTSGAVRVYLVNSSGSHTVKCDVVVEMWKA